MVRWHPLLDGRGRNDELDATGSGDDGGGAGGADWLVLQHAVNSMRSSARTSSA